MANEQSHIKTIFLTDLFNVVFLFSSTSNYIQYNSIQFEPLNMNKNDNIIVLRTTSPFTNTLDQSLFLIFHQCSFKSYSLTRWQKLKPIRFKDLSY